MKQVVCIVYAPMRLTQPGLSVVLAFRSVDQLASVRQPTVARLKAKALSGIMKSPTLKASFVKWKTTYGYWKDKSAAVR